MKNSPVPSSKPRTRLAAWWSGASSWTRFQAIALGLLMVGHAALQLMYVYWYIEDAAISFAFARHAAEGEGLVAYPGGERVEGYSNPTWVLLMTLWHLLGVDGFISSKIMGAVFGAATIAVTFAMTRLIRERDDDVIPLVAAFLLALDPQFVIWASSGLENSLFCLLLALGSWLTLREARHGRWPWSAAVFMGLAITRPEGILYGFFAGLWALIFAVHAGRGVLPSLKWLGTFFVPFSVYQAARYGYFAWPFPNTYYAKLTEQKTYHFLDFESAGWKYLRNYGEQLWEGWFTPIYVVGMAGLRRARAWLGLVVVLALIYALFAPRPDAVRVFAPWWPELPTPEGWKHGRVWVLAAVALITPLLALGRPGWRGLVLNWTLLVCGLYFAVHAGGDWMRGFRWLSLVSGPQAVLYALALAEIADALARRFPPHEPMSEPEWFLARGWAPGWSLAAGSAALVGIVLTVIPSVMHLELYTRKPETSPAKIQRRVNYMHYVQNRMHLDHVVNLDVDMGGTMWWSGHELVDIAGLVDVPMGHHAYQREFIREYVFEERRPHFAHLHGGWERKMGVKGMPEYPRTYFEIPGYPTGSTANHLGNRVRMDLLVAETWEAPPERVVRFEEDVTLHGIRVPLGEAGVGRHLYVELAWSGASRPVDEGFRAIAFVRRGDTVKSWDVAPGYDWYTIDQWKRGQIVYSRHSLELPDDLPPGAYDLGVVVFGKDGGVLAALEKHEAARGGPDDPSPALARGEVRWEGLVTLLAPDENAHRLDAERAALEAAAAAGRCEDAEAGWERMRMRRSWDRRWRLRTRPEVATAIGACWLARGQAAPDREAQVAGLARARWWDHRTPGLDPAADPLADALIAEGREALARAEWEVAYRRFTAALSIDAARPWARRWAEEARDHRLGIDPVSVAAREAEKERVKEERDERRRRVRDLRPGKTFEGGDAP